MDYDYYCNLKNHSLLKACSDRGNGTEDLKEGVKFVIRDKTHLNEVKAAVERYEKDNFDVTYEEFEKMDKVFEDVVSQLKYTDDECGYDESELHRIVRVMHYLDWNYAFNEGEITEDECLDCLKRLYRDAMRYVTKYKSKRMTTSSGGWHVEVNLEEYSVKASFCLFDHYISHEELCDLERIDKENYEG